MVLWKETELLENQKPHTWELGNILRLKEFLHTKNKMGPACLDSMENIFTNKFEWQITIGSLATSKYFPEFSSVGLEDEKKNTREFSFQVNSQSIIRNMLK